MDDGEDRQLCIGLFMLGSPLTWPPPHPAAAEIKPDIFMGGNEGGGRGLDRWSLFEKRPTVQKSPTDPGSDSSTSGEKQPANESAWFD